MDDLQASNLDWPGRQDDLLAGARALIGRLALKFDGRVAWRDLHLPAAKLHQRPLYILAAQMICRRRARNLALGVVGVRLHAKNDRSLVGFATLAQIFSHARRKSNADRQHAAGRRVQRASMTNAPLL